MKIAIAGDHAAYEFKTRLRDELVRLGYEVEDHGTDSSESCDYPDYGIPAARSVASGDVDRAILMCTNGIGMSMLANRIPGVRAALVYSETSAVATRAHHDSNVLCLGAGEFPPEDLLKFVTTWLATEFEGGRHERRIGKVTDLDGA